VCVCERCLSSLGVDIHIMCSSMKLLFATDLPDLHILAAETVRRHLQLCSFGDVDVLRFAFCVLRITVFSLRDTLIK